MGSTPAPRAHTARPGTTGPDGAETWYRISNRADTATAAVHLYGDIGSWGVTAAAFVAELGAIDTDTIDLYINSPGGEVFDGLAIHNALRSHRARVLVQVDSLAASIASVIAMAGDRVVMSPHSQLMIHDASGAGGGNPAELREYADFLDRQSDNIAAVYAERAGGTVKQWRARMRAETWYFADEAVAAGLADAIAAPARQDEADAALAASWDLSVFNYAYARREEAPDPDAVLEPEPTEPTTEPVFDVAAFRDATCAALDPMPGFDPEHFRSTMSALAFDAPAPPEPVHPALATPPPAAPTAPEPAPSADQVLAEYFRTVMVSVANDAPAPPETARPEPAPAEPDFTFDRSTFERSLKEARL